MENIGYIGLSQQLAMQQQMQVTANNIANMNTPGYKGMDVLFTDYLNKARGSSEEINQVINQGTYRDLAPGSISRTGNTFDVALHGNGYFAVQTASGTGYTRDGSFSLNAAGELIDQSGDKVLGDSGSPIVIPPEARSIQITPEGVISSSVGEVGRLKVTDVDKPQLMQRLGNNLYSLNGATEKPAENTRVVQGALEGSNVNAVVEMNKMIEILRNYQETSKLMQNDHERIRGTIQKLSSV